MSAIAYYCSRGIIAAVAERRRDIVQDVIDHLPAVGDHFEKRDIELWEGGCADSSYMIILRRVHHDEELLRHIEDMVLERWADERRAPDDAHGEAAGGGEGPAPSEE